MSAAIRKAKQRGQTFNALIRTYNENIRAPHKAKRTILDSVPSQLEGYSGKVHDDRRCSVCGHAECVPVEHKFMCVPCHKVSGNMTRTLGTDAWIYDLGFSDLTSPEESAEFDDETLELLATLDCEVDLNVALAPEPLY